MKTKEKINIFIVDDNNVFALTLKADIETAFAYAEVMPFEVHTFETGEACMKEFDKIKPQVVILDYNLNSVNINAANGTKVLDWIKKGNDKSYVIMLTSDDRIDIAIKSLKHGASDYIVKTDTQFKKVIFSLFNFFKIKKAEQDAKRYGYMFIGMVIFIVLLVAVVVTIQIFQPSIFDR